MSILIDILLDTIQKEFDKKEPEWNITSLEQEDMQFLNQECNQESEFDPTNKRKIMFQNMIEAKAPVIIAKCPYGKVTAVLENGEQAKEIPWGLWARIFRLFSNKKDKPFKVYFLANTSLRHFPSDNKPITPENINGGYTYRCNHETILIYRAEDATRVLIHELQHSCCLDNPDHSVDQLEAETEAWAELLYVALLSEGNTERFHNMLSHQCSWLISQNAKVQKYMTGPKAFPWRYTIGKEEVWKRWGLLKNNKVKVIDIHNSLRLTFPVNNEVKKRFHVNESSTII